MADLHASLHGTWKSRISKFPPDVRSGGSIPQLLILNSEMNLKKISNGGVHSMEWPHSQRFDTFPVLLCVSP